LIIETNGASVTKKTLLPMQ